MMTIPPTRPSSTPPSGNGEPEDKKVKKDFKLPGKKGEKEEEQKKKGLFDIAAEGQIKEMKTDVQQAAQELKAEAASAVSAKAQVSQVSQIIQKMVAEMRIDAVGKAASLTLQKTNEVPPAFAGSNLTISYEKNGLVITFDNFMSPQQQQNAFYLVDTHKEQLTQMVQSLQAKNIKVAELNIGNQSVALPRVEPLPPPFQAQPGGPDTRREGGREGGERRDEGRRGPPGPRPI